MLTPVTTKDWIALISIIVLGVAVWVWLLPWMERAPFVVAPAVYDRLTGHGASRKPFASQMNFTPVALEVVIVTACCLLYGGWMQWSTSRPISPRGAARKGEESRRG